MTFSPKRVLHPKFADWFCAEYSSTAETIEQVLKRAPSEFGDVRVDRITLWRWRKTDAEFDKAFKIAQQMKGSMCLDEAQHEAERARAGTIVVEGERNGKAESSTKTIDNVERSKLICTAFWKRATAFDPALRESNVKLKGDPENPINVSLANAICTARKRAER